MKPDESWSGTNLANACFSNGESGKDTETMHSEFLPAERDNQEDLQRQRRLLFKDSITKLFFDSFPNGGVILNNKRQIVAVNRLVKEKFGPLNQNGFMGLRLGEALGCKHAQAAPHGCGTTSFCRYCGAAQVLSQVRLGRSAQAECHIVTEIDKEPLDLLVWGTPFKVDDLGFVLLSFADISHEKRRQALEWIFFHDVLNTVNGIMGAAALLDMKADPELKPLVQSIHQGGDILAREIRAQSQLLSAESGTLEINVSKLLSKDIIVRAIQTCSQLSASKNRSILAHPDSQNFVLSSDESLLSRVLTNLIKNALEASQEGEEVNLRAGQSDESWIFSVHNQSFMPIETQLNLFKRSFSTKGMGRGLGLYSVRLLTEKYLKGRVEFESTPQDGTFFKVILPKEQDRQAL